MFDSINGHSASSYFISDPFKSSFESLDIWMEWIQKGAIFSQILSASAGAIFRETNIWNDEQNNKSNNLTRHLSATNGVYEFKCPLGKCFSNNKSTVIGLTTMTQLRRLTLHLSNTSSISQYHKKKTFVPLLQIPKNSDWKRLYITQRKKIHILEAIVMKKKITTLHLTRLISNVAAVFRNAFNIFLLILPLVKFFFFVNSPPTCSSFNSLSKCIRFFIEFAASNVLFSWRWFQLRSEILGGGNTALFLIHSIQISDNL